MKGSTWFLAFFAVCGCVQGSWMNIMDSLVPIPLPNRCQDVDFSMSQEEWSMFDTMIQTALNGSSNVLVGRLIPTTPKPMRRMKRSEPKALQLFQILANGRICFAGRKLSFDLPSNPRKRQSMLDAINTFIDYLSHRRGLSLGHLRGF